MSRRDDIAQAAMELAAEGGSHALTHRRVDRRLGVPEGTTSNYARTRRELMLMVVERVAQDAHLRPPEASLPGTVDEAVDQLALAFEEVAARGVDTRARMSLAMECLQDPELHALLTIDSPIRRTVLDQARRVLESLDVPDAEARAVDLAAILNGLFFDRLIGQGVHGTPADVRAVLRAWLVGVGS